MNLVKEHQKLAKQWLKQKKEALAHLSNYTEGSIGYIRQEKAVEVANSMQLLHEMNAFKELSSQLQKELDLAKRELEYYKKDYAKHPHK